jgi:hypothetical protein
LARLLLHDSSSTRSGIRFPDDPRFQELAGEKKP